MAIRDRLLGTRAGYSLFRRVIKADRHMQWLLDDHIKPASGTRLLDVGCGTGDLAQLIPEVTYVGIDHNPAYLSTTANVGGPEFVHADLADMARLDIGTFDTVVALGVIHHLDDDIARHVVSEVRRRLVPGGRFVTVDPVFHPDQRSTARVLMALDRGRFVRHPPDYERLMRSSFDDVEVTVRFDLNPFPYTHCIMTGTA
jgi:SAM-dependent methyltransferase